MKKKIIMIVSILIVVGAIVAFVVLSGKSKATHRTYKVSKGDIQTLITGSGTISAGESKKEYAKVSAEITDIYFKEGDIVKTGDIVLKLDGASFENTKKSQIIAIEQAELSKQNIQKQINDLKIVANTSGYVSGLNITEGSYVNATMEVCDLVKNSNYEIVLQFLYTENAPIKVGDAATVTTTNSYSSISGVVSKVSDMRTLVEGNSQVVEVTINVPTTGYSLNGAIAQGKIVSNGITLNSANSSSFHLVKLNTVRAKSTGTVESVNVSNGAFVNKGDVIAVLENENLDISLENAELTLKSLYNQLDTLKIQEESYIVTADIDGVLTSMPFKAGDAVAAGTQLFNISNNNTMEFKIPVDELDVAKLDYNQKVRVSVDALPETEYEPIDGRIKLIPLEGTTAAGITDYYVTIELDANEDVRISMSANADIIVNSAEGVLIIPIDAITTKNGVTTVDVLTKDANGKDVLTNKEIKTGISDTTYIEVVSGLAEGEEVVIPQTSTIHMISMGSMMEKASE